MFTIHHSPFTIHHSPFICRGVQQGCCKDASSLLSGSISGVHSMHAGLWCGM
jgi:hypothetical protein